MEPVKPAMDALSSFLDNQVGDFEPEIRELVHEAFGHSGKRLRPMLLFYGAWDDSGRTPNDLVRAAAVFEMVHLATLIHDDILDDATLRHGAPTVAAHHGTEVAVLLGDALLAHSLGLAAAFPTTRLCKEVSRATRQLCTGEVSQTLMRGHLKVSMAHYLRVIDLKTAELFRAAAEAGAWLAGKPDATVLAIGAFARHLGIAYQMYDDIADFFDDESHIGKTLGTDLASGKFTLPLLLLLERLPRPEGENLVERIISGEHDGIGALRQRLAEHKVLEASATRFDQEMDAAADALAPCAKDPSAPHLLAMLAYIRGEASKLLRAR